MGIDPTKYGMKDYAAEFTRKADEQTAYNRGRLEALGITVPIGRRTTEQPAEQQSVEDEVRGDLGVKITNSQPASEVQEEQAADSEQVLAADAEQNAQQPADPTAPLTEEQIQERMMFEGDGTNLSTPRTLTDKTSRNAAIDEAQAQFMAYGTTSDGQPITDETQARQMAENYVRNKEHSENFYSTRTYLTKDDYNAAQKAKKQARQDYYNDLRAQGVGRREARRRANEYERTQLVHNERLKNKDALQYIEEHRDQFYDEDGNFSQVKYKQFTEALMNTHTQEGETRNAHLSLKERREQAQNLNIDDDAVADFVHRGGGNFEYDHTEENQIAAGVGIVGGAAAIGALLLPELAVGSTSASTAAAGAGASAATAGATAGATAAAAAGAEVVIEGAGAAIGAAAGAATFPWIKNLFRDNGGVEPQVYEPGKPKKIPPEQPVTQPPQVCQLQPDELHDVISNEVDYCPHIIQKGDDPYKIVVAKYRHEDGSTLSYEEALQVAHELKMIHGCANYRDALNMHVGDTFRCYTEFDGLAHSGLKGKKYVVNCDAETDGKMSTGPMKGKIHNFDGQYNGAVRDTEIHMFWYSDCDGNRSNIFTNVEERDNAMAAEQERLNAAAGK